MRLKTPIPAGNRLYAASRTEFGTQPLYERARTVDVRPGALRKQVRSVNTTSAVPWLVTALVTGGLIWGYIERNELGLTPAKGFGYWIGIAGGLVILATLAYPLRKYWRLLGQLGTVAGWFQVHMLLGIFGPVAIMFHANFQLGAVNSNVALITMLCVAGSGIIGRYLYRAIHYGLHGRRVELGDMVSEAAEMRLTLGGDLPQNSPMWAELERLEAMARQPSRGIVGALLQSSALAARSSIVRGRVTRGAKQYIKLESRQRGLSGKQRRRWLIAAGDHLEAYFLAVRTAARLILFERLFAFWHVLHVPIFVVMVLSVVVHIVAVHFY